MAATALKQVVQLGTNLRIPLTRFGGFGIRASKNFPSFSSSKHFSDMVKPNGQHLFLVDTLALVRRLEEQGIPSRQAKTVTAAITKVLNEENVSLSLVSKEGTQSVMMLNLKYLTPRAELLEGANLFKFKPAEEVQSSQSSDENIIMGEQHFSLLQQKIEELRNDINIKKCSELTQWSLGFIISTLLFWAMIHLIMLMKAKLRNSRANMRGKSGNQLLGDH